MRKQICAMLASVCLFTILSNAQTANNKKPIDKERLNRRLLYAAVRDDIVRLKNALKDGADINARGRHGRTPLIWAAAKGNLDIVIFLLEQEGINVKAKARTGKNALISAAERGHNAIVERLLENSDISENVDAQDEDGKTALMYAAQYGHKRIVSSLLQYADSGVEDDAGKTAAYWAKNDEIREML